MSNPVIFVSLGPGEPDLITLKGLKALQNADCIFCPETRTISGQIFSRAAYCTRWIFRIPPSPALHCL